MRKSKGFTLIELMVVILIVAILAAVLAPMMSGRINESKWTEGKTAAGTIATALRAYCAENEAPPAGTIAAGAFEVLGITDDDLQGKYFNSMCYSVADILYDPDAAVPVPLSYTITINPTTAGETGHPTGTYTLDETGEFVGP